MTAPLAARLSRALVGCHPRRWRQRYAGELLEVLDQHHPTARTVLNLAASAVSTHLDPAYRAERRPMIRLRRHAPVAAVAGVLLVLAVPLGYEAWTAAGERDALLQAEQAGPARVVLDRHRDIAHQLAELLGQPVQRSDDHFFENGRVRPRSPAHCPAQPGKPVWRSPNRRHERANRGTTAMADVGADRC